MRKLGIGIVIILVLAAVVYWVRKGNSEDPDLPQFETTTVERGNIRVKVLSTGTIEPFTRVEVSSPVNGRIDRVEVDEGNMVKEGDILAWISSEDRIALLDAARSGLESARRERDEEAIKSAQEAYEIADRAFKAVPLTNSISGEVIVRSCEPGQNISTQSILFVISDRLVASVEVDEVDIGKIKPGQRATIVLDAFPDEIVESEVEKISREGRVVSDIIVYDVIVEPLRVPSHWSSGMTANVEFIVEEKQNVLFVPRRAVQGRTGETFVFVLREKPEPRNVETGISDGQKIEITKGVEQGDTILLVNTEDFLQETNDHRPPMQMLIRRPR
jgi:macrolide-specific efflux system membrane fusion protein